MKYTIRNTKKFDKDLKRCAKRGLPMRLIAEALKILEATGTLPNEYRPHKLVGKYAGKWECHIDGRNSDWIMVWEQNETELTLLMLRTGSHSDIF
ncbi:MAG: type II toxin-antitoxin system YafQ family toxin [Clostridium sp.]|nr:type II toxin-antitoxin system YafQ family toxin [Clostridium sp.]